MFFPFQRHEIRCLTPIFAQSGRYEIDSFIISLHSSYQPAYGTSIAADSNNILLSLLRWPIPKLYKSVKILLKQTHYSSCASIVMSIGRADVIPQISYSGIPAAATLSVELLKQAKYPHEWRPKLPRADVIQNLSQFLGCLDWVRPTEGNYKICVRMRKIIKRVLDEILELPNPSAAAPQTLYPPDASEMPQVQDPEMSDVTLSACLSGGEREEVDFLDWLNSVDWTRDVLQDAWM